MIHYSRNWSIIALVLCFILIIGDSLFGATFTVTNTNDTGPGSLRDAINNANANFGNDLIDFNVAPGGLISIFPVTPLPQLIDNGGVTINGLTQPGGAMTGANPPSTAVLLVEINGSYTGFAHGLWVTSSNNSIQGLIINNFEQDGIRIEGGVVEPFADFNYVYCNFIGTDPSGRLDMGNGTNQVGLWAGVSIRNIANGFSMNNLIENNLISGNYAEGVNIVGPIQPGDVAMNHVNMNYIGTDITGTVDLGNDHEGICLSEGAHNNDLNQNLISANDYDGIGMQGFDNSQYEAPPIYTTQNIASMNIIGLDINLNPLPNSMHGVAIGEYGPSQWGFANDNQIVNNTIAENGGDGVAVWEHSLDNANADNNLISQNMIYRNGGLGIDLQNDGITGNDISDPDTGPNQDLNFPIITSAVLNVGVTTIMGYIDIDSDPTQAIVELFHVNLADPSGYGEGDQYLGFATPDVSGNWSYIDNTLNTGDLISATTTDQNRNTSEFSEVFIVSGLSQTGACCYQDGSCSNETSQNCIILGGTYQGDGTGCLGDANSNGIDDACEVNNPIDSCDYYKSPYADYVPNGMPDFDQKQSNWTAPSTGSYSHCGPVALANCFWWFDSKFETNIVPPPAVIDNYPLVSAFGGPPWDDHDANNVIPFIDSLAVYCNTNPVLQSGTNVFDLANGASNWLAKVGLLNNYTVNLWPVDGIVFDFDSIKTEVLESQDVILLLGFWEEYPPGDGFCERIGGHYVTIAGTCTDQLDSALCISDPFFDMHEGEPPAGSAHSSNVHNDASNISGPHGTIYHDKYFVQPVTCQPLIGPMFQLELTNYPASPAEAGTFYGQNTYDPTIQPVSPQGGIIHTVIEWAVVICPVNDTCANQMPGDADGNGIIDMNDITFLVSYLYSGGPAPNPLANGDPNGDCEINVGDIVFLSNIPTGGPLPVACTCVKPDVGSTACCFYYRGNVNYDPTDAIDIADLVFMVAYMFQAGATPPCIDEADVDASGGISPIDISDLVYLVAYMFQGGVAPLICP